MSPATSSLGNRLRELTPRKLLPFVQPPQLRRRGLPLPRYRHGVLGLELSDGVMRFVEVRAERGRARPVRFGEVELPESRDYPAGLKALISEHGVEARDVHLVNSTSRANFRVHSLPEMPDKDMREVVQAEIESEAELLGESLLGDWCWLNKNGRESEVLIGKIPTVERNEMTDMFAAAGFRLQAMTVSSLVLAQAAIHEGFVPDDEVVGLLDIGHSKISLAFVTPERVGSVREIFQGVSATFIEEGSRDLDFIGVGLEEITATVEQIRRSWQRFVDANPGVTLNKVLLTGETSRIPGLEHLLANDLRVPVVPHDPSSTTDPDTLPEGYPETASAFAVPWVLATTAAPSMMLNHAEGVPDMRPVRMLQGVAGGVVAASIALAVSYGVQAKSLEREQQTLASVETTQAELSAELGVLEEVQVSWRDWIGGHLNAANLPGTDLRPHIAEINRAMPDDLRLLKISFASRQSVWHATIDAVATSREVRAGHAALDHFVAKLSDSALLRDVALRPLEFELDYDGIQEDFTFTVLARLVPAHTEGVTP